MRVYFALAASRMIRPWWKSSQVLAAWRSLQDAERIQAAVDQLKQEIPKASRERQPYLMGKLEALEEIMGIVR